MKTRELFSTEKGKAGDPPVLLVHGLLGVSRNLMRLSDALVAENFHVVSYDQRGHGRSEHPLEQEKKEAYSFRALAADLISILDKHRIEKAHLIGHSMGGRVCLFTAAEYPERTLSLTLLDSGGTVNPGAIAELRSTIDPLLPSYSSKQEAEAAFAHHEPHMRQFLISNLRDKGDHWGWVFDLSGIRDFLLAALQENQMERWKKIKVPCLVVRGENSEYFTQKDSENLLMQNSNAEAATISGAGHWLHADNFEDTKNTILKFLKGLRI